ncbi:MAG TPA: peptidylprolyl isomerase [Pyrinomonadaceae bacterium]|jgi:parvulin-like peptidyl-prolyl isomerase
MEDNKDRLNSEDAAEETGATSPASEIPTPELPKDEATAATENFNASETKTTGTAETKTSTVSSAASTAGRGMSAAAKGLVVVAVIVALGAGLLVWKIKAGGHGSGGLTKLTNDDIALLLKDENPMALKQLSENPETKKKIVESLKHTLAMASQARKDGMANDPEVKEELESIRTEIVAASYDKKKNADKGPMPPFGFISEDEVKAFYVDAANETKFKTFIGKKIEQAKEEGRIPKDREPTEEQLASARDFYAKARIYEKEAESKKGELGEEYNKKVELQVKLQQEQFLARRYADKVLKDKIKVTDEDVQNYLKAHPELDTKKEKRAKAEEILARVQKGEDFTALAKEFSEDPGSKDKGGLYENVRQGQFVPEFETAALALEPGQVASQLVESKFGYHIIKLEKKGTAKDAGGQEAPSFDARHILISTMITDPENPRSQPMSAEDKIRAQLEEEKEKKAMDELLAKNPVEIPDDFAVPEPSAEQLEQMKKMQEMQMQQQMQQMQQQPQGDETDAPTTAPKPAPKKK